MKRIYFMMVIVLAVSYSFGQKQYNQWCFGDSTGLDFNSGAPVSIAKSSINTLEGCASIADKKTGSLLFYTDGTSAWDRTNTIMPHGVNMGGNTSSTQSALIVPFPGSDSLYYVFTVDDVAGFSADGDSGVNYNIVDMSLNGGLGDVTTVDKKLLTPTTEKLCATYACNDTDIWVMAHLWNSDAFYAYLITKAGISAPVISNTGIVHKNVGSSANSEAIGYMKFSPNEKKLAVACNSNLNTVQIFDFNNFTGVVSNPITDASYSLGSGFSGPYGVSFSPDNSRLYVTYSSGFGGQNYIYQYNMLAGNGAAIIASRVSVTVASDVALGALQIAPDGKIYFTTVFANYVGAIKQPNQLGSACQPFFVFLGLDSPGRTWFGLPNLIDNFSNPPFTASLSYQVCQGDSVLSFTDSTLNGDITCYWDFDDALSGTADTSTLVNPTHAFSSAGSHTIKLILSTPCRADTIIKTISIDSGLVINAKPVSPSVCAGMNVTLTVPASGSHYAWSPNAGLNVTTGDTVVADPTITTTYVVTGVDSVGCNVTGTDVVTILTGPNKPTITISVTGDTLFSNARNGNQWYEDDTLIKGATDSILVIKGRPKGFYTVTVINEANGCGTTSDSTTGIIQSFMVNNQVSIYPNPTSSSFFVKIKSPVTNAGDWSLQLIDILGRILFNKSALHYINKVDVSNLPDGMYFIAISNSNGRTVFRVIKQN